MPYKLVKLSKVYVYEAQMLIPLRRAAGSALTILQLLCCVTKTEKQNSTKTDTRKKQEQMVSVSSLER